MKLLRRPERPTPRALTAVLRHPQRPRPHRLPRALPVHEPRTTRRTAGATPPPAPGHPAARRLGHGHVVGQRAGGSARGGALPVLSAAAAPAVHHDPVQPAAGHRTVPLLSGVVAGLSAASVPGRRKGTVGASGRRGVPIGVHDVSRFRHVAGAFLYLRDDLLPCRVLNVWASADAGP